MLKACNVNRAAHETPRERGFLLMNGLPPKATQVTGEGRSRDRFVRDVRKAGITWTRRCMAGTNNDTAVAAPDRTESWSNA